MLKWNDTAVFDLLTFFEGKTMGEGVFEDRQGNAKRRFTIDVTGRGDRTELLLDERFDFDDGEVQHRTWRLRRGEGDDFTGRCADAVGDAIGRFDQDKAFMVSTLRLPVGSRMMALRFSDAFYRTGPRTMLNRSIVSKWGVRIGLVLIGFRKP